MFRVLALSLLVFSLIVVQSCGEDDKGEKGVELSPIKDIVVNEVVAKSTEKIDWIEIYNKGNEQIDIGKWSVLDKKDDNLPFEIPTGTKLQPGAYLLIEEDASGDNGFTFGLKSGGDSVRLFDKDGKLADTTTWVEAVLDKSWGRMPNGTGEFKILNTPTGGAANIDN